MCSLVPKTALELRTVKIVLDRRFAKEVCQFQTGG